MSSVDIVRRSYDAFARDDMDGVLGDMHPEIEWHQLRENDELRKAYLGR